jgi:arsenate reductase
MIKRRVLILCTGNSARSQLAEALVNARLGNAWQAFSAGTQPAAQVNPHVLTVLDEIGIHAANLYPKPISTFFGHPFAVVVTVCDDAAENCPVWIGQGNRIHIGFADPAAVKGDTETDLNAFRQTRDTIIARLLPMLEKLEKEEHG